jgi:hypothetical protein
MVNNDKKGLDRAIEMLEEQLDKAEPGSSEQSRITESLVKLRNQRMEEEKTEASYEEMSGRINALEVEVDDKKKSSKWQNILRTVEVIAAVSGSIFWAVFDTSAFDRTLELEEHDQTPYTTSFRTMYDRICRRKGRKR